MSQLLGESQHHVGRRVSQLLGESQRQVGRRVSQLLCVGGGVMHRWGGRCVLSLRVFRVLLLLLLLQVDREAGVDQAGGTRSSHSQSEVGFRVGWLGVTAVEALERAWPCWLASPLHRNGAGHHLLRRSHHRRCRRQPRQMMTCCLGWCAVHHCHRRNCRRRRRRRWYCYRCDSRLVK